MIFLFREEPTLYPSYQSILCRPFVYQNNAVTTYQLAIYHTAELSSCYLSFITTRGIINLVLVEIMEGLTFHRSQ